MDASKMSIKELKQVLVDARVPIPSGIEKSELIALVQKQLSTPPKRTAQFSRIHYFGSELSKCKAIFLFFHGYGADELQFTFLENFIDPGVAVVSPKSPDEGWWPLNVMEWAIAMQSGQLETKIKERPRGLVEARESALAFAKELTARAPADVPVLIGGFSQGAVMAMDVALAMPSEKKVFVAAFSPFVVDMLHWEERAKRHGANLRALVTHGTADPIIPYFASEALVSLLKGAGCTVKFASHSGGHTLGDEPVLRVCRTFFSEAANST